MDLFLFPWELRGPVLDGSYIDLFLFLWELRGPVPVLMESTWTCSCSRGELREPVLFLEESCVDLFLFLEKGAVWVCSCSVVKVD